MKIAYIENSHGQFTEVVDYDADGKPMASKFAGWQTKDWVKSVLAYCRKNDRGLK